MRIIAGKYRGRKIERPASFSVRPTKDRIREAVFNFLGVFPPRTRVLDLFAGSGAYGLEALSRGAEEVLFVDNDPVCCNTIRSNISSLGIGRGGCGIKKLDVFSAMSSLASSGNRFEVVFADPPYNTGLAKKALIMTNRYDILNPSGLLIIEHNTEESPGIGAGGVNLFKQKTYKDITVSYFRRR
jgi:16S rRNA (guanine966-N2)-methyltransferase